MYYTPKFPVVVSNHPSMLHGGGFGAMFPEFYAVNIQAGVITQSEVNGYRHGAIFVHEAMFQLMTLEQINPVLAHEEKHLMTPHHAATLEHMLKGNNVYDQSLANEYEADAHAAAIFGAKATADGIVAAMVACVGLFSNFKDTRDDAIGIIKSMRPMVSRLSALGHQL